MNQRLRTDLVKKAYRYAYHKHMGQFDSKGRPHTYHLDQVHAILSQITDDETILAAAWLHDVHKDTKTLASELSEEFGPEVAALAITWSTPVKMSSLAYSVRMIRLAHDLSNACMKNKKENRE